MKRIQDAFKFENKSEGCLADDFYKLPLRPGHGEKNKKAVIAYFIAGDPCLEITAEYILAAQEAGADMIEIGIPFSDPVAESEPVQKSALRALESGTRTDGVFEMLESVKDKLRIPVIFMTYMNPVFVYGYERFFSRCAEAGICGVNLPDLPFEEQNDVKEFAQRYGVEIVMLAVPSSADRIKTISRAAGGFVYFINDGTDLAQFIGEIKNAADIPVVAGVGVSTPEQARLYLEMADGIIIADEIARIISEYGRNAKDALRGYIETIVSVRG